MTGSNLIEIGFHLSPLLCSPFSPTGIVIWIPQLYINHKLGAWNEFVWFSMFHRLCFLIGQILCISKNVQVDGRLVDLFDLTSMSIFEAENG